MRRKAAAEAGGQRAVSERSRSVIWTTAMVRHFRKLAGYLERPQLRQAVKAPLAISLSASMAACVAASFAVLTASAVLQAVNTWRRG